MNINFVLYLVDLLYYWYAKIAKEAGDGDLQ